MSKNITLRKCYKEDKKKAITKGFLRTDERYLSKMKSDGCTAIVALLTDDNKLYVGNAGLQFNNFVQNRLILFKLAFETCITDISKI